MAYKNICLIQKMIVKEELRTKKQERHIKANSKMEDLSPIMWTVTFNVNK